MLYTLAWGMPGLPEWIIIGAIGLLVFGKRLPEVGRSLGKGIVEFKKGLKGLEDDMDTNASRAPEQRAAMELPRPPQRVQATAPKFGENVGDPTTPPQG